MIGYQTEESKQTKKTAYHMIRPKQKKKEFKGRLAKELMLGSCAVRQKFR